MGIFSKIKDSKFGFKGQQPPKSGDGNPASNLHAQGPAPYSILDNKSKLDLNGKTPSKYLDNLPE